MLVHEKAIYTFCIAIHSWQARNAHLNLNQQPNFARLNAVHDRLRQKCALLRQQNVRLCVCNCQYNTTCCIMAAQLFQKDNCQQATKWHLQNVSETHPSCGLFFSQNTSPNFDSTMAFNISQNLPSKLSASSISQKLSQTGTIIILFSFENFVSIGFANKALNIFKKFEKLNVIKNSFDRWQMLTVRQTLFSLFSKSR